MPANAKAGPYPRAAWRLLVSPPADGPLNMAIDEAVLVALAEGASSPTLRFYAWTPPCLSLGYSQTVADVDRARLTQLGWDLVRRATGGRAILHTDELTYSVVAPLDEPRVRGGVVESYQQLSAGLLRGLAILGLNVQADRQYDPAEPNSAKGPVCFEVPSNYEITAGIAGQTRKLLGSAQVRKRGVVLQHGTLPLHGDIGRICDALVFETEQERRRVRARVATRATTVAYLIGRKVSWQDAAGTMTRGFAEALNLDLRPAPLTPAEESQAATLRAERYATPEWTNKV
jgi:lipoate-protein ligase A